MPKNSDKLTKPVMNTLASLWKLEKIILDTLDFKEVIQKVVNSILLELGYLNLGYKVVVLALIDEKGENLKRIALSRTEEAEKTRAVSEMPFEDIIIPITATENLCIKAILENKPQVTHYFPDILTPPISVENALQSQKNAGIETSLVFPLNVKGDTIGVMIFSMDKDDSEVTDEERVLIRHFTDLVALAVQNSRIYNELEKRKIHLELANAKLKLLDKTKDEFISITSHELKTPMTIIKSYLWMLQSGRGGPINDKQNEYLEKAMKGAERMLDLINDMLNVSRIEQGRIEFKPKSIKFEDFLAEYFDELEFKAKEKNLELQTKVVTNLMPMYVDEKKLGEILVNLVGNSIKYTDKGSITIKAESHDTDFVKISVTDTGRGIAKDEIQKLFHKFQRLDSSYKKIAESGGTGLGLYIVKLYISHMGGSVGAESKGIDKGSTFWITVPTKKKQLDKVSQPDQNTS